MHIYLLIQPHVAFSVVAVAFLVHSISTTCFAILLVHSVSAACFCFVFNAFLVLSVTCSFVCIPGLLLQCVFFCFHGAFNCMWNFSFCCFAGSVNCMFYCLAGSFYCFLLLLFLLNQFTPLHTCLLSRFISLHRCVFLRCCCFFF